MPQPGGSPSSPLGTGMQAVTIDADKRDHRMDNNPEYYKHSEASLQFQKVCRVAAHLSSTWTHAGLQ